MVQAPGAFWAWSVARYDLPGVAPRLLDLQDTFGLEVGPLLFGIWLADTGRSLGDDVDAAVATLRVAAASAWHWQQGVVKPLRAARRAVKALAVRTGPEPALYARFKALELEAEREAHTRFEMASVSLPRPASLARSDVRLQAARHLEATVRWMGVQWTPLIAAMTEPLLDAILPSAD